MSYEVLEEAKTRLVRDAENALYHFQVGFGNHFRTLATMKAGKLDQLRAKASQEAQQGQQPPQQG